MITVLLCVLIPILSVAAILGFVWFNISLANGFNRGERDVHAGMVANNKLRRDAAAKRTIDPAISFRR